MKIVNIDVSDQLKFKNIEDTKTDLIKFIKSTLEVPTDNYKSVLLNFNFISPDATIEGLNLFAIFTAKHLNKPVEVVLTDIEIDNNYYKTACFIPNDVLTKTGTISLGVYGYSLNEDETLNKRISLQPISFAVIEGSYKEGAFDVTIPEPTDFEIYFSKIEKATADLETLKRQTEEDINDLKVQTEEDILKWETTTKNELDKHLEEQANNISDISDNVNKIETTVNENAEKIESHYIPTNTQNDQAWYLALSGRVGGLNNNAFILSIQQIYSGNAGLLYANIRCNNSNSVGLIEFKWLSNTGLNSSDFKIKLDGNNYYLYMRTPVAYGKYQIKVIQATSILNREDILTFYNPTAEESVAEPDGINPSPLIQTKSIKIVELDSQFVVSKTGGAEVLPFNKVYPFNENTKCIENIGNGQMKVVNGSHLVKISGQLCFTAGTLSVKEVRVCVNGSGYATAPRYPEHNYDSLDIPEKIMGVNEGDIITIVMVGTQGDTIEVWGDKTYLNVEVLS